MVSLARAVFPVQHVAILTLALAGAAIPQTAHARDETNAREIGEHHVTTSNIDLCMKLLPQLGQGRIDDELVQPDIKIWTASQGPQTGDQYRNSLATLAKVLDGPLLFDVIGVTASEDRVAIEARSSGRLKSGVTYENAYHFLFRVDNGRVAELHAYFNTAVAMEVLGPLFAELQK